MRLSRWQSFNPVWNQLHQLQSEMNQLFDRWGGDGGRFLGNLVSAYPPVNVWEDADAVHVEAELPGLNLNDLEIYVTGGNQLTIKGERKQQVPEKSVRHRDERTFGAFTRVLTLPFPVDADKVDARFENGVLVVNLPKHEAAKPRKIAVKSE
jgi:HSP20 family protein